VIPSSLPPTSSLWKNYAKMKNSAVPHLMAPTLAPTLQPTVLLMHLLQLPTLKRINHHLNRLPSHRLKVFDGGLSKLFTMTKLAAPTVILATNFTGKLDVPSLQAKASSQSQTLPKLLISPQNLLSIRAILPEGQTTTAPIDATTATILDLNLQIPLLCHLPMPLPLPYHQAQMLPPDVEQPCRNVHLPQIEQYILMALDLPAMTKMTMAQELMNLRVAVVMVILVTPTLLFTLHLLVSTMFLPTTQPLLPTKSQQHLCPPSYLPLQHQYYINRRKAGYFCGE